MIKLEVREALNCVRVWKTAVIDMISWEFKCIKRIREMKLPQEVIWNQFKTLITPILALQTRLNDIRSSQNNRQFYRF